MDSKRLNHLLRHPQGNSVAERAIKTIKGILEKEEDPYLGLLSYRSTPLSFGRSPAELLMNRKITNYSSWS